MKLSEARTRFETSLRANGRSPHTVASYTTDVALFERWLADGDRADALVDAVTSDHVAAFIASDAVQLKLDGGSRAAGSVNKVRASLRAFFRWLVDTGAISSNPTSSLASSRRSAAPPELLTAAEQKRVFKTIRERRGELAARDRLIIELFLGTGIRLSSLVGLDVEDVRLDDKRLFITAKGGHRERVFLKSGLRRLLRIHLRGLERRGAGAGALFRSSRGTRMSARQVQTRLIYWLGEAGIEKAISPHSLRHTFGTRLYARTRDLRLVQRALGHRHVTTTQVYVQLADDVLEDAIEAM